MSFVPRHVLSALAVALATALSAHALQAQTAPAPVVQQGPGGTAWMSGGAGEQERAAMAMHSGELPLKLVLSAADGEYVLAEHLAVRSAQGDVLTADGAGPIVMMRLPPGRYTIEATVQGRTQRRQVSVGSGPQTIAWRWPS